jgi:RNA polymerase sigma-70 factor (ECF subfamily)
MHNQDGSLVRSTDVLLQRARSGDRDALGELLDRYHGMVRRTAYAYVRNLEEADDIAQEVSLSVVRKLHTFQGNAAFSTWLTRIAINRSLMRLREAGRRSVTSLDGLIEGNGSSFLPLADSRPGPEQQYSSDQHRCQLHAAVQRLPSKLRDVARRQIYGDVSIAELAQEKGLTIAATKSRAYRAKQSLMGSLGRTTRSIARS